MSDLVLWNQALGAAHARGRLSSLTERSPEADLLREWYGHVIQTVQSAAWWPACRAVERLGLVAEASGTWTAAQPEPGYAYAYALPEQMLRPWHLVDFSRFSLSFNAAADKTLLNTNTPEAILIYGREQDDTTQWSALQRNATIFGLAAAISGPLSGKTSLVRTNYELANNALREAQAAAANDIGAETKTAVPWIAARGAGLASTPRFYYPFGELFPYAE